MKTGSKTRYMALRSHVKDFTTSPSMDSIASFTAIEESTQDEDSIDEENIELFTDTHELKSLLILASGPFLSQVAIALYGVVNTTWVAKSTCGQDGVAAIGAVVVIEYLASAISTYFSTCVSAHVSYLFGKGCKRACSQLYVDFLRICIICGIILPLVMLPSARPLLEWFEVREDLIDMAYKYLIPSQVGSFFLFLFYMNCGLLEAVGHSGWYAISQIGSFVLNGAVLNPLFLMGLKFPLWGSSLATIIAESIPAVLITIFAFAGKLSIQPKFSMLFAPFSRETWAGLKTGFADLIEAISLDFPMIVVEKLIIDASSHMIVDGKEVDGSAQCLTVWSIINRLEQLIACVAIGIGEGLLPLASYAFGAQNYHRVIRLMGHALWVMAAWAGLISAILIIFPRQISSLWGKGELFFDLAADMIRIYAYSAALTAIDYTFPIMLIAMKCTLAASLFSVIALLIPIPTFAYLLNKINDKDPTIIIWTFDIADVCALLGGICLMIKPFKTMHEKMKLKKIQDDNLKRVWKPQDLSRLTYTDYSRVMLD